MHCISLQNSTTVDDVFFLSLNKLLVGKTGAGQLHCVVAQG